MVIEKEEQSINNCCPECGGEIISNSFEKICRTCGLVTENLFKETSFLSNNIKNQSRSSKQYVAVGNRPDFIGGLGTFIDYEGSKYLKDKDGRLLSPDEQKLFRRLKKNYAQFLRIKNHETEYRVFNILDKISSSLNLNKNTRNNAAYYYKKIVKKEQKVINHISLIAFCIYFAVRREFHNAPITINEITETFQNFGHRVNPKLIIRDGIRYKCHLNNATTPHKTEDYLTRLIDQVINHENLHERLNKKGISWSIKEFHNKLIIKCRKILKELPLSQRGGRNPFILTGAIIYLADKLLAKENSQKGLLTQWLVSDATKIPEYSIRDHYVNLLKPIFLKKSSLSK